MNIEPINKAKLFQRRDKEEKSTCFLKAGTCIFYKIMRLDVRKKFHYTLGRKFFVFGYSYPNMGIEPIRARKLVSLFYKYRSYTFNTTVSTYI